MAQVFVHGRTLAAELGKILGITRPFRSIKIEGNFSEAASVTVEFVPSPDDVVIIGRVLERYQLAERESQSWRQEKPLV